MLNLVLKDFLVQKKTFLMAFIYSIFFFVVFSNPAYRDIVYAVGSVAIGYIFISYATTWDDKNDSEIMLNSLPVVRKDIVMARYVFAILVSLLGTVIMALTGIVINIAGFMELRYIALRDFAISLFMISIFVSLYLPIHYKFKHHERYFRIILFLLGFFIPQYLVDYIKSNSDSASSTLIMVLNLLAKLSDLQLDMLLVIMSLLLMAVSMAVSLAIYNNKEF